jgi:hypothetical protein
VIWRVQWTKKGAIFSEQPHDFAYEAPAEHWAELCRAAGYEHVEVTEIEGETA